jgi:outer membrane protein OmpU
MKNITKIGLTALAGSLVMVSANAVELSMTGALKSVFTTQSHDTGAEANNGKGISTDTDMNFRASGELDNGFTIGYHMQVDTDGNLSATSSQLTVGMGSLGTVQVNDRGGSKANSIDDVTPSAYKETWNSLSTINPSTFGSRTSSGSIEYRIPAQELMGVTLNASVLYDPNGGTGGVTEGGVATTQSGNAYTVQLAHESGLEIGAGAESVDDGAGYAASSGTSESVAYVKYSIGGLSAAYQGGYTNSLNHASVEGADKETEFMGVAYTAGDLTVSYGESSTQTKAVSNTEAGLKTELESIQIAYVLGAMTISAAMSETSAVDGATATDAYEENTLAVSFAF